MASGSIRHTLTTAPLAGCCDQGPVFVATHNADLPGVIQQTPKVSTTLSNPLAPCHRFIILRFMRLDPWLGLSALPPQARRRDLVFLQNGYFLPLLRSHGLEDNTQVLLYMSGEALTGG